MIEDDARHEELRRMLRAWDGMTHALAGALRMLLLKTEARYPYDPAMIEASRVLKYYDRGDWAKKDEVPSGWAPGAAP